MRCENNAVLVIDARDNVGVAVSPVLAGERVMPDVTAQQDIPCAHKVALKRIECGEIVIKYGAPIGRATADINAGEHVHSHNLSTALNGVTDYAYNRTECPPATGATGMFNGFLRADGSVGTRNDVWVIPTVGCANDAARKIASRAQELFSNKCSGVYAFTHPYGCSQLGVDSDNTSSCLAALSRSPNASCVLFVSLGCENNNIDNMKRFLGDYDADRVRFLVMQEVGDELEMGVNLCGELCELASQDKRTPQPLSRLVIGMKCGGSDAFSGITANELCGAVADRVCASGGSVILTEVPEMFGAEERLLERAESREVFNSAVDMINGYKDYFLSHGEPVYENPSPGNKAGGITTLEEKSLGCIRKGGSVTVTDVLPIYGRCKKSGLTLLGGPGNDIVSSTNLTAAGANIILFTTGRGTPLGAPVPTVKIASNSELANRKKCWIDFDAGAVANGLDIKKAADGLLELIIEVAGGARTANERTGNREIAIFKGGITL